MQLNFPPKKLRKVGTLTAHFYANFFELKICICSSHCRSLVFSFLILISSSFWPSEAWVSRWADRVVIASLSHCRKKARAVGRKSVEVWQKVLGLYGSFPQYLRHRERGGGARPTGIGFPSAVVFYIPQVRVMRRIEGESGELHQGARLASSFSRGH